MKFALEDKTFDGFRVKIPDTEKQFELKSFGRDQFILFERTGESAEEIYTFTKQELKILWLMLSSK